MDLNVVALLALLWSVALPAGSAVAQVNAAADLLDSPVKTSGDPYFANEAVVCSIALPATAALFGADTVTATSDPVRLVSGELFGAYRCWEIDETCGLTRSWSTAFAGPTMTGIAVPNGNTSIYWAIDPATVSAQAYLYGVGTAAGISSIPLPVGGLSGAAVIDDHAAGEILCVKDIVFGVTTCVDTAAAGVVVCSYATAGSFGNSVGDAARPFECSGQTLVEATGTIGEGQVVRVSQLDCSGADPACTDRWDVSTFSTFTNGVDEFLLNGEPRLFLSDNAGSNLFIIEALIGLPVCQSIDAGMALLYCNSSQGGAGFTVDVDSTLPLSVAMRRAPFGPGQFVHHMNAGMPDNQTVTPLLDLGNSCFDFLGGSAVAVENNIGRVRRIGASSYFGTAISDPAAAPTFLQSLSQVELDTANLAVGSIWTLQSIHVNSSSSSKRGASLSNALAMRVQ